MVAGHENSLNNRFLPFSNIKTEAVVQIDDDICATKEDLEFGFRYALMISEDPIKFCTKQICFVQNIIGSSQWDQLLSCNQFKLR